MLRSKSIQEIYSAQQSVLLVCCNTVPLFVIHLHNTFALNISKPPMCNGVHTQLNFPGRNILLQSLLCSQKVIELDQRAESDPAILPFQKVEPQTDRRHCCSPSFNKRTSLHHISSSTMLDALMRNLKETLYAIYNNKAFTAEKQVD